MLLNNSIDDFEGMDVGDVTVVPGEEVSAAGDGSGGDVLGVGDFCGGDGAVGLAEGASECCLGFGWALGEVEASEVFESEACDAFILVVEAAFLVGQVGGEEGVLMALGLPPGAAGYLLVVDVGIAAEWIGEVGDEASFEVDGWLVHESPFVKRAFASAGKERSELLAVSRARRWARQGAGGVTADALDAGSWPLE